MFPGSPAVFSTDRRYRYVLWRIWDPNLRYLAVIGLNPSTADETKDDPTVAKLQRLARKWGYGGLCMLNLFAWRDTDPKKMKQAQSPTGQENDFWILQCIRDLRCGMILAAWGAHGTHHGRARAVQDLLRGFPVYALEVTKGGQPGHPLYLREDKEPFLFTF